MNATRDFWSRRKAAVAAEAETERARAEQDVQAAQLAEREEQTDAEILAELDLPDPDTLKPGDDIGRFMARAVPQRIRQRALRKLWRLNPVLANLDGLNDYDGDYTGVSSEPVLTSYQVGKGLLAHLQEMARQAEPAAAEEPPAADDAPVDEPIALAEVQQPETAPEEPADTPQPRAPRRMRFAFDEPGATA